MAAQVLSLGAQRKRLWETQRRVGIPETAQARGGHAFGGR